MISQPVHAAMVPVTSTLDSGPGSLRQLVLDAAPGDTVVFDSAVFSVPLTITLTSGQIEIPKSLTIDGTLGGVVTPTISGTGISRTILVGSGVSVSLSQLFIHDGGCFCDFFDGGGGILNYGTLTVAGSRLSGGHAYVGGAIANYGVMSITGTLLDGNGAQYQGSAVYNEGKLYIVGSSLTNNRSIEGPGSIHNTGQLTVVNSTFVGNRAIDLGFAGAGGAIINQGTLAVSGSLFSQNWSGVGGAIYNEGSLRVSSSLFIGNIASAKTGRGSGIANCGTLEVEDSAFASNVVNGEYGPSEGGGIYNMGALTVLNSTFYSNTVHNILSAQPWDVARGGGIANHGIMTVTNSTLYGNRAADSGDGIYNGGIATLYNTIAADNCAGGVTDGGHNLEDANTCGFVRTQSLTNTNPLLGPLGDYGGAVPTTPLLPGSPAIDAGDDVACPATDARGVIRPFGPHCDIGAFEANYTVRRLFLPRTRRSGLAVLSD